MTVPRFEYGKDERGELWCVYVDGVPLGRPFVSEDAAFGAMQWLRDDGWLLLIEQYERLVEMGVQQRPAKEGHVF